MNTYWFPILILLLSPSSSSGWEWEEVDQLIQEFQSANNIPGVALSIVNVTGESSSKGYGLMDRELLIPMSNQTLFLIASISKSFTAITTCRILQSFFPQLGESVLDTPIVELAPSFNLTLNDRYRTERVTFRDLLAHRTCLNSYGLGVTAGAYSSRADRLYRYRYIGEQCGFRSGFEYSNAMFILAGEIVAHIASTPFEVLVQELLVQIEMNSSLIVGPTEDYEDLLNMSRGYYLDLEGQLAKMNASVYNSHSGAAAGGIISTATDMSRYLHFHLNKGKSVEGVQVVEEEVMEWLYKSSNALPFPTIDNTEVTQGGFIYGLGLTMGIFRDWTRVAHEGDLSPFTSRLAFYPQLGLGLFTVINGPGFLPPGGYDHLQLHNRITQLLLNDTTPTNNNLPPTKKSLPTSTPPVLKGLRQAIDPTFLVGLYGHPYEGDVNIRMGPEGLELSYGIWAQGVLLPTEVENLYNISWRGDIVSIFLAYNGGPPLPLIQWHFPTPNSLLYLDGGGLIEYQRNATIDTYPTIPWAPGSC